MQILTSNKDNLGHTHQTFIEPTITLKESGASSERSEIISRFVEKINKERVGTKYPHIKNGSGSMKKLCVLINQHPLLKTNTQLEDFYSRCKLAKSFSACCYGTLNIKNGS